MMRVNTPQLYCTQGYALTTVKQDFIACCHRLKDYWSLPVIPGTSRISYWLVARDKPTKESIPFWLLWRKPNEFIYLERFTWGDSPDRILRPIYPALGDFIKENLQIVPREPKKVHIVIEYMFNDNLAELEAKWL